MQYIVLRTSESSEVSYYDGSVFTPESAKALLFTNIQDARYIQGVMQSQMISFEVCVKPVTVSYSIGA